MLQQSITLLQDCLSYPLSRFIGTLQLWDVEARKYPALQQAAHIGKTDVCLTCAMLAVLLFRQRTKATMHKV